LQNESRRACPELVERRRLAFRPVQIRFGKCLGSATTLYGTVALSFVIPSEAGISYFTALTSATYVVLPKENHMHLTEAATLDRKSGEAEGSAVPRTLLGNVFSTERTRISCHAALDMATCAAFGKESRMKIANATKLNRKPG
jgi:hypothetical protein